MPSKKKPVVERPTEQDLANNREAKQDRFKEGVAAWHARWRMEVPQEAENELLALLGR